MKETNDTRSRQVKGGEEQLDDGGEEMLSNCSSKDDGRRRIRRGHVQVIGIIQDDRGKQQV